MLLHAISHRPGTSNAYPVSDKEAEIRVRTAQDIDSAIIFFGDKYDWVATRQQLTMTRMGQDELFYYWRVLVPCPAHRCRYAFCLRAGNDSVWLAEDGFHTEPPRSPDNFFDLPWLHPSDALVIPDWVRDAVFYHIFPDRFANGDTANDPAELRPWDELPNPSSMYGGDLRGIIERLPYLSALGVNAIYLTPVFHAPSNHKYDTIDYFTIDPHFGDISTLQELVRLSHLRGIRVVLDAVFNHMSWQSREFQDVAVHGLSSPFAGWFHLRDFPLQSHPRPNYDTFAYVASMPKINTQNKEAREFLLRVAIYWIEETDIDGWRLDVANEVDHAFWRELRQRVRAVKPDAYLLGEVMHQADPWLQGDQFDGVMNYPLTAALIAWLTGQADAAAFANRLVELQFAYSRPALEGCLNLLDSHDSPRLLSQLNNDRRLFCLAVVVLLTMPGAPSVYYGDEVGMTGGGDPDCRRGMVWEPARRDAQIYSWYKRLISLRHRHRALRRGDLEVLPSTSYVAGWWRRVENDEELLVLINSGVTIAPLKAFLPTGTWVDLLTEVVYEVHHDIGPLCALILARCKDNKAD